MFNYGTVYNVIGIVLMNYIVVDTIKFKLEHTKTVITHAGFQLIPPD